MNVSTQIKLIKDRYAGSYSCGLTMVDSSTMDRFKSISETEGEKSFHSEEGLDLCVSITGNEVTGTSYVQTTFSNGSEETVTLEMITTALIKDISADKIHRFLSFWSAEGRHKVDDVCELNMEQSWAHAGYRVEKFGAVGSMPVRKYFPIVVLENSKTGTFTGIQLYCNSSWQIELIIRETDDFTVSFGLADRDFGQFLKTVRPGETFVTPKACIATGKSLNEVCDKLVKSQQPDISAVDNHMGITFNEYCTTWGTPTEDSVRKICDRIEGSGIQYFVIDAGWYGNTDSEWWNYTGDWSPNPVRFPNGLKVATDYIKSKGMIPGLWFELESVAHKCKLYVDDKHLVMKDNVPLSVGDRRFLDMEDSWVIEHLKKEVIGTLRDNGFGYIKVDYNDTMGMGCDGPDGPGENLRRKLVATKDFFRLMKLSIPDLVIENCSSGGHRLEPSMMEIVSMASFSDAHETKSIPIIAANLQRLVRPEQNQIWSVLRADDSDNRIFYLLCGTFFGRMGLSGDVLDLTEDKWKLVLEGMEFYKKAADIIQKGYTSIIENESKSYNNLKGGQLVIREYEGRKLVIYHRFSNSCSIDDFIARHGIELDVKNYAEMYGRAEEDFGAAAWIVG